MTFLENIPLLGGLMKLVPHMVRIILCLSCDYFINFDKDYEGQKLAEKIYQWVILLFGVSHQQLAVESSMCMNNSIDSWIYLGLCLSGVCTDHIYSWCRMSPCRSGK